MTRPGPVEQCVTCGKSLNARLVRYCNGCDRPLCEDCDEGDADCVGDPARFVWYANCNRDDCDVWANGEDSA